MNKNRFDSSTSHKSNPSGQGESETLRVNLSFFDHLEELRSRLIKCLLIFVFAAAAFSPFIDALIIWLARPVGKLVFTSPPDAFLARFTIDLFGGFFLALPYILFQVWQFVASGLKEEERRYVLIFGPISLVLFLLGMIFAYFVAIPFAMQFLLSYSSDYMVPMITVNHYISFVGSLLLAFGVVFEMPLVLMFLTVIGIATPAFLEQKRKHAIVLIFMISAILTPPDVITQIMMAVPLMILYEISIFIAKLIGQRFSHHELTKT